MTKSTDKTRYNSFKKKGYYILIFGFIGFFLWSSLYTLNQGVYGSGFVVSTNEKIEIISPISGLIKKLEKRSGDSVLENEDLLIFDTKNVSDSLNARLRNIDAFKNELENAKILVEKKVMSINSLPPYESKLSIAEAEYFELKAKLDQMKVMSPVNGELMNFSITSSGVNVSQGQHLFDILPNSKDFQIKAEISLNLGDKILEGMPVDITFPTLAGSNTKRLVGRLKYVSADKIDSKNKKKSYLEAIVTIDDDYKVDGLRAGLPATIIIKTGPQTLLSYIIRPISDRINRGMQ